MRKRLYEIIEPFKGNDKISTAYDIMMIIAIVMSIIPLAFRETNSFFYCTDIITTILFVIDYIFRFITADYRLGQKGILPFVKHPFTPWAIIDLISILPGLTLLNHGFKLFRMFRMFRIFRTLRIFKTLKYSRNIIIIIDVIKRSKDALLAVCTLAVGYILISALIIFNVEGESFESFFDAIYWATVSLTTVGYGDIYPVTKTGRIITMISSILGIAIVALPAGIITAGYMDVINSAKKEKDDE